MQHKQEILFTQCSPSVCHLATYPLIPLDVSKGEREKSDHSLGLGTLNSKLVIQLWLFTL